MARPNRIQSGINAAVVIAATIAIAVLVNVLSQAAYTRLDLTENDVNSLSDTTEELLGQLEGVEIVAYISPDLPDTIKHPQTGQPIDLRIVEQKFRDILSEYQSRSNGNLTVRFEKGDVVEAAKRAKLALFAGEEATTTEEGALEFKKYALGATLHYGDVMERMPMALDPAFFEFELTKHLMRLEEKAAQSIVLKDILRAGKKVADEVASCDKAMDEAVPDADGKPDNPFGLMSAEASKAKVEAVKAAAGELAKACAPVGAAIEKARAIKLERRNKPFENLLVTAEAYQQNLEQLLKTVAGDAGESNEEGAQKESMALQMIEQVDAIAAAVETEHDAFVDSPGRRQIGFVCAAKAFCPFPSGEPLVPQELRGMLTQQNPFVGQVLQQLDAMAQDIDQNLVGIQRQLFERRGYNIVRVDLDEPVPPEVESLVILGPKDAFTDYQLYAIDQFMMNGGSVVAFINSWDVAIQNLDAKGELSVTKLTPNQSNIGELLGHWGIRPNGDLVVAPESHDQITLLAMIRQGQFAFRANKDFPYPLFPIVRDFDETNPLVRGISSLTLPYTSSLVVSDGVTALAKTSPEAATTTDANFPLLPQEALAKAQTMEATGPHVVAAVVQGEFMSYFKGKEAPKKPEKPKKPGEEEPKEDATPEPKRLDQGQGRLLVIGSNLGLEDLSRESIFDGFTMAKLTENAIANIEEFRSYGANYQNWQVRLQQMRKLIFDNLQLVYNALDWSVSREGLVALRSKQIMRRPLEQTTESEQTMIRMLGIVATPILVLLLGILYWLWRRARRERIATLAGAANPIGVKGKAKPATSTSA